MKGTSPKQTPSKHPLKTLAPRKDPKGGVKKNRPPGGDCDEFGCGGNHNEVLIQGAVR